MSEPHHHQHDADPTCRDVIEGLADYLDGTMPGHVRSAVDAHFAQCRCCVDYLKSYQQTIELARAAMRDDAAMSGVGGSPPVGRPVGGQSGDRVVGPGGEAEHGSSMPPWAGLPGVQRRGGAVTPGPNGAGLAAAAAFVLGPMRGGPAQDFPPDLLERIRAARMAEPRGPVVSPGASPLAGIEPVPPAGGGDVRDVQGGDGPGSASVQRPPHVPGSGLVL